MLSKCCTQYASKFGKLSSGHRTGKGQFSFQSQRMCKLLHNCTHLIHQQSNAQNSSIEASTVHEPRTSRCSSWLEKAEEPEIKLPISVGSLKNQESFRKTSTSAILTTPKPLTVWITINRKILKQMGIPDHLTCLLRNRYASQEAIVKTRHGTVDWFQIGKGVHQGCILSPCLFNLYAEYIM